MGKTIKEISIETQYCDQSIRNILKKFNIYQRKNLFWDENIINFIKYNFPIYGSKYCSNQLNIPICKVQDICKYYKIKMPRDRKIELINKRINKTKKYKIKTDMFLTPNTPIICYILGLLWADGSIRGTKDNTIRITLKKNDALDVKKLFLISGNWNIREQQYKCHKNPVILFSCCDKIFYNFLYNTGYYNKSVESASKILDKIPEELRHYWWRGYYDGDGTFSKTIGQYQISITSTIEQDWNFLKYLPSNIIYKTKKYSTIKNKKVQSYSRVYIINKINTYNFFEYIYTGKKFGLERKYNLFKQKFKL
jgi:hypothetical protein